ncbi:hypothetical protein, partial [Janibacter terrae]|uniref:hypothetical protein n=1 Tax=Janibacter terrae TaxID=103817 RepID=UPI0031F96717
GIAAMALAAGLSMGAVPVSAAPARTDAGCNVWVYEVVQTAGIYDTWSTNSERVGYAYQGNEIHSLSVGESWVNVDYLYTTNYGDSPLIKYHNDYFQKAYLDYKTCFSR